MRNEVAQRRARLAWFEERMRIAHENDVFFVPEAGLRYIEIHPTADDEKTLTRLELAPEDCVKVDAYFDFGSDIAFIQVGTKGHWSRLECGQYLRWSDGEISWLNAVTVVKAPYVTRPTLEGAMMAFAAIIRERPGLYETATDKLQPIE